MKDGKSLPVLAAQRGTEASGYQIITSNNSKKTNKTWKAERRSPGSCSVGSVWRWLRAGCAPCAHPACGVHLGLWPRTLLRWLRGTPGQSQAWLPAAASGQVPLSLTEVAAELFSRRIRYGGFWAKGDELRLGEREFPPEPRGCSVQADPRGCCCSMGLADPSSIPKITLHPCRMVPRVLLMELPGSPRTEYWGLVCPMDLPVQSSSVPNLLEGVLASLPRAGGGKGGPDVVGSQRCHSPSGVSGSWVHGAKACLGMLPAPFPSPCPLQSCS